VASLFAISTLLEILGACVLGSCGFLSFSLVFCRFGGRLETTLYIHFTRRWVMSTRRSSASRRKKRGGRGGKTPFFAIGLCRGGIVSGAGSVDRLRLAWTSPFRVAYTASSPPRLSPPPLRPPRRAYAGRESEQADALCLHKCVATASASLSMRGVQPAGSVWGLIQVYAGDG